MKRPAILSILMLVPLMLAAQNQLTHKKKIFVAVDGKMYCHKSLPIYVRISNSPDDTATSYLLKSEQTPKYSNPMYLDAEGWNSVRSPSAVDTITKQMVFPEQDIIFDIYADSKSPYSSLVFNRSAVISRKNKFMSKGSLTIEVKASDELSGVEGIYVSLDGGAYQKQTARIILDKEKTYTIKYYAADNVGNVEQPKTEVFVVDLGNPMSDVEIFGDSHGTVISGRSQIKLKSNDSISGTASIRYRLDNQKETIYTSPIYAS